MRPRAVALDCARRRGRGRSCARAVSLSLSLSPFSSAFSLRAPRFSSSVYVCCAATATKGGPFPPTVTARKAAAFVRPPRSETPEVSWASYAYSTESSEPFEQTAYICSKLPIGGAKGSMEEAMSPRGPYFPRGGHSAVKTEGAAPFSTYANNRVQMLDSGILRDPRGGKGK